MQKNTKKLDLKTLRTVMARFTKNGTTLSAESKKLGFHAKSGQRALTGERKGKISLQRKNWLIRLSKGLPIEDQQPQTTGEIL